MNNPSQPPAGVRASIDTTKLEELDPDLAGCLAAADVDDHIRLSELRQLHHSLAALTEDLTARYLNRDNA